MKRVLAAIIVPPHLKVSGGARAGELLSAALSSECDMTVASMMNGDALASGVEGQGVKREPVRSWLPPFVPWQLLPNRYATLFYKSNIPQLVTDGGYDLVHIHNPMPALEMERVAKACVASGTPYVVHTHGFNEVANGNDIYGFDFVRKQIWKWLVQKPVARVVAAARGVFALSPADFEIVRNMGFGGEDLKVVSNGVPLPKPASKAEDEKILEGLGVPVAQSPEQITCMFLANHTPNKGLPVLLEAFSKLDRDFLLVIGGEKRADVDYDAYVRGCKPGQKIVVTGRLEDEAVGPLLRRSDLFVFPTLADTFPLVILEAMAHGLPVVASRVGGIPHQVDDTCGKIVAPGKPDELRDVIDALADQPEQLAEMGRTAHQRMLDNYTWAGAAKAAASGYQRILRTSPAQRRTGMTDSAVRAA